jgi:hypothetical protein
MCDIGVAIRRKDKNITFSTLKGGWQSQRAAIFRGTGELPDMRKTARETPLAHNVAIRV